VPSAMSAEGGPRERVALGTLYFTEAVTSRRVRAPPCRMSHRVSDIYGII